LFSDTSDGGKPKDSTIAQLLIDYVDKLFDQTINGIKTFQKNVKFGFENTVN
jgi:hypothetical protein